MGSAIWNNNVSFEHAQRVADSAYSLVALQIGSCCYQISPVLLVRHFLLVALSVLILGPVTSRMTTTPVSNAVPSASTSGHTSTVGTTPPSSTAAGLTMPPTIAGSTTPSPVSALQTLVNQSVQAAVSGLLTRMEDSIQTALASRPPHGLAPGSLAGPSSSPSTTLSGKEKKFSFSLMCKRASVRAARV